MGRIRYIDNLKYLAILTVLMWHLMSLSFGCINEQLNAICASSSSHTFMFLAGLMAFRKRDIGFSGFPIFLKKNAIRLLVPFLVVGGAFGVLSTGSPIDVYNGAIQNYWFLPVLFALSMIGYVFISIAEKLKFNNLWIVLGMFLGLWIILNAIYLKYGAISPFYLNLCKIYPHFVFGLLAGRYESVIAAIEKPILFPVSLALFVIFVKLDSVVRFPASPLFGLVCWWQIAKVTERFIPEFVSNVGKYTLEIYVLHFFIMPNMPGVGKWLINQSQSPLVPGLLDNGNIAGVFLLTFAASNVLMVLCVVIAKFIKSNEWTSLLIFGIRK